MGYSYWKVENMIHKYLTKKKHGGVESRDYFLLNHDYLQLTHFIFTIFVEYLLWDVEKNAIYTYFTNKSVVDSFK
jgi:hypothetical protein